MCNFLKLLSSADLLEALSDASATSVRIQFHLNFVAEEHFDPVHAHLASKICKHNIIFAIQLHTEEGIRQCFYDNAVSCVLGRFCQGVF
jgi:hypothetical protein